MKEAVGPHSKGGIMVHENQGYFLYCEQLQYHYTGMELFGCVLVFIAFMLAQFSVKVL